MRAVRVHEYGGPEVLKVDEIERPVPGEGQILIEVRACGINPLDAWFRSGHLAPRFPRPLPYTPGADIVGTVAEAGAGVSGLSVGDLVMGILSPLADGGYAEFVVGEAERFTPVPEGLDPVKAAAAMTPVVTGLQLVDRAVSMRDCRHILVIGAVGSVGRSAMLRALDKGIEVTAVVLAGEESVALGLGANHAVAGNASTGLPPLNKQFDCIIDTVGPQAVAPWEDGIADGGLVISVVPVAPAPFRRDDIEFVPFAYGPNAAITREAALLIRDGRLESPPVEQVSLDGVAKAHEVLLGGAGGRKFVIVPAA